MSSFTKSLFILAALMFCASVACAFHGDVKSETFTFFAWRSIGLFNNDMPHTKIPCYLGADGTPSTGETGMAEQGWHELHPLPGPQTSSYSDRGDAVPVFAGPVMASNAAEKWAVYDMPIYWPYQADLMTWSQEFTQIGQTFVATQKELDKVSVFTVRDCDDLVAMIKKDGPNGEQVGPAIMVGDGPEGDGIQPGWRIARWQPEDIMLEVGKTYYLDIKSKSGKKFSVRCHSTGNVYQDGVAYYNGVADPMSDLGAFFAFQREDATRSKVLYAGADGWVRKVKGVYFKARTANIRGIYAELMFPNTPFHLNVLFRVYKVDKNGELVRVGSDKSGYNYTTPGTQHHVAAIYAADEVPLEIGSVYYLEAIPQDSELPEDVSKLPKMDLNVRIYGEKTPGMNPIIYRQHITDTTKSSIKLAWEGSSDVETVISYGLDPYKLDKTIRVPRGVQEAEIKGIAPTTTVSFKFTKKTSVGGKYETPVYQARTLDNNSQVVKDPPLRDTPHHEFLTQCIGFLNLAVMDHMYQPQLPQAKAVGNVAVVNADFEDGINGWTAQVVSDKQQEKVRVITCKNAAGGAASAGWDIDISEDKTKDVNASEVVYQKVKVTRGKTYMLSGSLYTLQEGHGDNWYAKFNWGDVKARLVCDPSGGTDFSANNSTQWFRTDGKWLTFARKWKAESDTMTIGVGFTAVRDWQRVAALADNIKLVEVAE